MVKRVITFAIACVLLMGSIVFPLGDFSLTRDLPAMYRSYSKVTTPEEMGMIDFIGDYLLHGKEIFGHNAHDKPQSDNSVQFQHQPVQFLVILTTSNQLKAAIQPYITGHHAVHVTANTSDFKNKLFRPPLA